MSNKEFFNNNFKEKMFLSIKHLTDSTQMKFSMAKATSLRYLDPVTTIKTWKVKPNFYKETLIQLISQSSFSRVRSGSLKLAAPQPPKMWVRAHTHLLNRV